MKNRPLGVALGALAAVWPIGAAGTPELKYVVIVSRHGVRSPTWEKARLDEYSADPWPEWPVAPGELTPHGRTLIRLMGAYYHDWLIREKLLRPAGCAEAPRVYIRADREQRTLETGRAFAESLLPGCKLEAHAQPATKPDPLFSGFGTPEAKRLLAAVQERLGANPQDLITQHRAALEELRTIVKGMPPDEKIDVAPKGRSVEMTGPFATGSTFSENLLLEYTEGLAGPALGWGRLTREKLERILEVHTVYADLTRRTRYLAQARSSNLLWHVLRSLEQAVTGKAAAGALDEPGGAALLLAGHDTNLSNLSGMLNLSWKLPGYQADDAPPGGALIFELWRNHGQYQLSLRFVSQSMDQMRLEQAGPPESTGVALPGCGTGACDWDIARRLIANAIDPKFVDEHSR